MSPEEFKQIIDLVNSAKGDAVSVVYLILAKDVFLELVGYGIGVTALILGARLARMIVSAVAGLSEIRSAIGCDWPMTSYDWQQALSLLRKGAGK